jgi:purine-nucleoside phosphorylase
MTAHINAKKENIAKTVLMPGDPLRAKMIADTFLTGAKLVSNVRGMLAYTGTYKGKAVTIMASGMGMPSIGIYSYELYKEYDVDNIIRIGSCGSYKEKLALFDIVLETSSYTTSSYAYVQNKNTELYNKPSKKINKIIKKAAKKLDLKLNEGLVYSSDVFYSEEDMNEVIEKGCIATEMESFALFHNADILKKNAATILTVSNNFITNEETTSEQRQNSFKQMVELALEATLNI